MMSAATDSRIGADSFVLNLFSKRAHAKLFISASDDLSDDSAAYGSLILFDSTKKPIMKRNSCSK